MWRFAFMVAVLFMLTTSTTYGALADNALRHGDATVSNSNEDDGDLSSRVAMLTVDRTNPKAWCMGLLIAPDAVLTYAHCVAKHRKKPLAWAFFGNSDRSFYESPTSDKYDTQDPFVNSERHNSSTNSNSSGASSSPSSHRHHNHSRFLHSNQEAVTVGDMDPWVAIKEIKIHPQYDASTTTSKTRNSPTTDLAIVRLELPRITTPFSLVSKMNHSSAVQMNTTAGSFVRAFHAFQMANDFVVTSRDTKLQDKGTFRIVDWRYCSRVPPSKVFSTAAAAPGMLPPMGQVCVVANIVEDRRDQKLANTFVMLDNKLVGLVAQADTKSASHRVVFLSEQTEWISDATKKQNTWAVVRMIVGGEEAPSLRGYVAGLRMTKESQNFCLGALIAPRFVLTAAHCVVNVVFDQVSVGSQYASTDVDGEQIKIKQIFVHRAYEAATFRNDYAIIELEYMSIQPPIGLFYGAAHAVAPGKRLTMYGYATKPTKSDAPATLQFVDLPVVSKAQCKKVLQPKVLDASMMCAGGESEKDACQGDSGGPLVLETTLPFSRGSLVAMASYGRGCGIKGMPAVYAVVATAASFIDRYVDGHRWITTVSEASTTRPAQTPSADARSSSSSNATHTPSPCGSPPSSSTATSSPPEVRSSDDQLHTPPPSAAQIVDQIAIHGGWKEVPLIPLNDTTSSLTIGASYSLVTRDLLANLLLGSKRASSISGSSSSFVEELTMHFPVSSLDFHSNGDLTKLAHVIKAFDTRVALRRRAARFGSDASNGVELCGGHR